MISCEDCLFWNHTEADVENQGDCHRFPPTPFLQKRLNPLAPQMPSLDVSIITIFPKTQKHLWCGEHVPKGGGVH